MDELIYILESEYNCYDIKEDESNVSVTLRVPYTNNRVKKFLEGLDSGVSTSDLEKRVLDKLKNKILNIMERRYGEGFNASIDSEKVNWDKILKDYSEGFNSLEDYLNDTLGDTSESNWDNLVKITLNLSIEDLALYANTNVSIKSIDFKASQNLSEGIDLSQGVSLDQALVYVLKQFNILQIMLK
jgi:hypothetical protein